MHKDKTKFTTKIEKVLRNIKSGTNLKDEGMHTGRSYVELLWRGAYKEILCNKKIPVMWRRTVYDHQRVLPKMTYGANGKKNAEHNPERQGQVQGHMDQKM